jgi:nucleoside-diphosphate-sugar epimerase
MTWGKVLVSGGAGFVGSNLVGLLLSEGAERVHIVDNLLSAERSNVPADQRVTFSDASIADPALLASLKDEYDYVFHLSTYHGNQSSIHDPLADHANNTLTTLKLYERIKVFRALKKVVYSAAGCSVAEKTFDKASATEETDVVSLWMDSPYSMSKVFGEFYSTYYFRQHNLPTMRARFQNVTTREILAPALARHPATVWRNVTTFIWKARGRAAARERGVAATSSTSDITRGLAACAQRSARRGRLQSQARRPRSEISRKRSSSSLTAAPGALLPKGLDNSNSASAAVKTELTWLPASDAR